MCVRLVLVMLFVVASSCATPPTPNTARESVGVVDVPVEELWEVGEYPSTPENPYARAAPPTLEKARAMLAAGQNVWIEEETVFLAVEAPASVGSVRSCCAIQEPMERLGETNIWALAMSGPDLDRARIGYEFIPLPSTDGEMPKSLVITEDEMLPSGVFRGERAPALRPVGESAKIEVHELKSAHLNAAREVRVARMPGADERAPVVFMFDGAGISGFADVALAAVKRGDVRPFVIVGIENGSDYTSQTDFRSWEYVDPEIKGKRSGADEVSDERRRRFEAHRRFVVEEVVPFAVKELGVSDAREDHVVMGVSNGATYSTYLLHEHPELFGHGIILSAGLPHLISAQAPPISIWAAAGTMEVSFLARTRFYAGLAEEAGVRTYFEPRVGGHDLTWWVEDFDEALAFVLGPLD